jgi:hypothetical protein
MSGCKIIRVKNLLGELLSIPGGIGREEAIAEAMRLIEELREEYEKAIPVEITSLEDIVALFGKTVTSRQLAMILDAVDPLLTLSGTFGPAILDAVVKRFCDLCAGMMEKNITAVAPLRVHLRAMRLVWKSDLSKEAADEILGELTRIHTHYGIVARSADEPDDCGVGPGEALLNLQTAAPAAPKAP